MLKIDVAYSREVMMGKFFLINSFILCMLLSGCQSTEHYSHKALNLPTNLIQGSAFPEHSKVHVESQEDIFQLNENIKDVIRREILSEKDFQKRSHKLIEYIFGTDSRGLAYRSNATVTAQQAFTNKEANCISLTILAYSIADFANLHATFQDVKVPEYWVRNGDYNMLSGHVNLLINRKKESSSSVIFGNNGIEVDFDPFIQKQNFSTRRISKNIVTAMFYNNKGAMALVNSDYPTAYAYFKSAILIAPEYPSSWANLGILYRFNDYNDLAEQSYRHALALDADSLNTLTNLSILLEMQGKFDESRKIDSAIIKHRIKNPYYHALLADEALYDGMPYKAIMHYKRALKLDQRMHEFHFGLAKAYSIVGDLEKAQSAMKKAIKANKAQQTEDKYIAKLNMLKQRD